MTDAREEASQSQAIPFGRKLANSEAFHLLFREGMDLIEETAAYLDGPGRAQSRALPWNAALSYANASMRLTMHLTRLASWLLLQRAVNESEMTLAEAAGRAPVQALARETGNLDGLPDVLLGLIARSLRLEQRVRRLDSMLHGQPECQRENAVAGHIARLKAAFGQG